MRIQALPEMGERHYAIRLSRYETLALIDELVGQLASAPSGSNGFVAPATGESTQSHVGRYFFHVADQADQCVDDQVHGLAPAFHGHAR